MNANTRERATLVVELSENVNIYPLNYLELSLIEPSILEEGNYLLLDVSLLRAPVWRRWVVFHHSSFQALIASLQF